MPALSQAQRMTTKQNPSSSAPKNKGAGAQAPVGGPAPGPGAPAPEQRDSAKPSQRVAFTRLARATPLTYPAQLLQGLWAGTMQLVSRTLQTMRNRHRARARGPDRRCEDVCFGMRCDKGAGHPGHHGCRSGSGWLVWGKL